MITKMFKKKRYFAVQMPTNEKTYLIKVGRNIKEIRKSKGLSQVELAHMCDFEKTNMSRIESGNNNPTIRTLLKIAEALEVNLFEILKP
jgi:transcriptional regulator with XRE-family HTH domain